MLQGCLFASASKIFFLSRISSSSGDDRSGRNGTNTGARAGWPARRCGDGALGWGACTRPGVGDDEGVECVEEAGEGIACGYCEGGVGCGSRPELFVNGCTASGSKDERRVLDDMFSVEYVEYG